MFLQKSSIHHLVGSDFGVALFRVLVDHGHNVLVIFEVNVILTWFIMIWKCLDVSEMAQKFTNSKLALAPSLSVKG